MIHSCPLFPLMQTCGLTRPWHAVRSSRGLRPLPRSGGVPPAGPRGPAARGWCKTTPLEGAGSPLRPREGVRRGPRDPRIPGSPDPEDWGPQTSGPRPRGRPLGRGPGVPGSRRGPRASPARGVLHQPLAPGPRGTGRESRGPGSRRGSRRVPPGGPFPPRAGNPSFPTPGKPRGAGARGWCKTPLGRSPESEILEGFGDFGHFWPNPGFLAR